MLKMIQIGVAACIVCSAVLAAPKDAKAPAKKARKPNPALKAIEDEAGLPRVLLIGDSISIGYTLPTRKLFKGTVNLHRIPANGGDTKRGLSSLSKWLGTGTWDVIHFNWGLHDLKRMDKEAVKHQVPVAEYEANLKALVAELKKTGATLIWASTTPVQEGVKPPRSDGDVQAYNAAAKKVMAANDIAINDLYAFVLPQMTTLQRAVNVHFTPDGSKALAEQVTAAIRNALGIE